MAITVSKEDRVKKTVQSIMKDYTNATGIACIYVDVQGKERSSKYNFTKFCHFMRSIPEFRYKCYQCDLYGGLESFKRHGCCPYRCHAGLVDFSIPVVFEGQLNGFIVSGQMISSDVRIPNLQAQTPWQTDRQAFRYFQSVPQYSYEDIMSASRVIHTLTNCYFPYVPKTESIDFDTPIIGQDLGQTEELSKIRRPEIRKAIIYIKEHLNCNLSLRTIADSVFLSESYLSKLFKQEMNLNLMQYINQCRVWEAEKLLASSRESIDVISRRLGYHHTSYFCRIFKQYTGETPHAYRKKYKL